MLICCHVPGGAADRVTEGGRAASTAPGVRFVRQEARASVFEIDSGAYDFTVKEFGRLDGLFNVAADLSPRTLAQDGDVISIPIDVWQHTIDVTLTALRLV